MSHINDRYNNKPIWVEFKGFFITLGVILLVAIVGIIYWTMQPNSSTGEITKADTIIRDNNYKNGKADAALKFVYFSDYQCPVCASNNSLQKSIETQYTDKVQFIHKNYPLKEIHPYAIPSAKAVEAAGRQNKLVEMSDIVYSNQNKLGNDDLTGYAKQIGLDMDKWNQDKNSSEISNQVTTDRNDLDNLELPASSVNGETKAVGVGSGTPTTVLIKDGKVIDWWSGTLPKDQLVSIIDKNL